MHITLINVIEMCTYSYKSFNVDADDQTPANYAIAHNSVTLQATGSQLANKYNK